MRRLGKGRKLGHVVRLVLNDYLGAEIFREILETVVRGQRVGAIDIEARDPAHLTVFGEMILVTRNQHRPAGEANKQGLMAFRVARHLDNRPFRRAGSHPENPQFGRCDRNDNG